MVIFYVHRHGLSPCIYKICRCDAYSIKRHNGRQHAGKSDAVPFYTAGMEIARENILKHEAQKNETLASSSSSLKEKNPANSTSRDSNAVSSQLQFDAKSEFTKSRDPCDESGKQLLKSANVVTISEKSKQSTLNFATETNKPSMSNPDLSIESKIDNLVSEFQDFKLTFSTKMLKEQQNPPLFSALCPQTVYGISELMSSWPNIKNIIEMTDKCKEIEFFGAASDDLSVLRCKTCFDYLSSKDKSQSKDVANMAKKGLGKYVTNNIMYLNILFSSYGTLVISQMNSVFTEEFCK